MEVHTHLQNMQGLPGRLIPLQMEGVNEREKGRYLLPHNPQRPRGKEEWGGLCGVDFALDGGSCQDELARIRGSRREFVARLRPELTTAAVEAFHCVRYRSEVTPVRHLYLSYRYFATLYPER
jgi:hypothetical protein